MKIENLLVILSTMLKLFKPLLKNILIVVIAFAGIAIVFASLFSSPAQTKDITLTELANKINAQEVTHITVSENTVTATFKDNTQGITKKESETGLSETLKNYGVDPKNLQQIPLEIKDPSGFSYWLGVLLPTLLPVILIGLFFWFTFRQARAGANQAMSFGKSNLKLFSPFKDRVTFADVAGSNEAKQELVEVVDFLKNPKKYIDIGAKIPRGVLLMGVPGTGKCITGESLVVTDKGMIPISEIPKYFSVNEKNEVVGAHVMSFETETTEQQYQKPSHWYDLGEQETIRIKTRIGTYIEGTPEHPIVVVNKKTGSLEFKQLSNVLDDDVVVVSYNHQAFGNYKKIEHEDLAYVMGLLTGDGGLTTKGRISFTSADPELVNSFYSIVRKYWNYTPIHKTKYDYQVFSEPIKKNLINLGLEEVGAEYKKIPDSILLAPKNIVKMFLRGLFDTDGYCGKEEVELSSSSEKMAFAVHHLLMNFGVINRIHDRKKLYNNKRQHYITISGDFLPVFAQEIGFGLIRKQMALEKLLKKQRNTNINLLYHQGRAFRSLWNETKPDSVVFDRAFYRSVFYKNLHRYINGTRNPSMVAVQNTLTFLRGIRPSVARSSDFMFLQNLSKQKLFFTKILSVSRHRARVYDFTVPKNHSFVANHIINHNTLLARAVAGEAGVPFFHISASEFVEMFVGVGASRTRDAFLTAKKAAPSILFIDEIDAIGRERGAGLGGGHDEREQTLNQILVEMDGFEKEAQVIVLAATNRPDILDPALLRPGRFDRRVTLDLPDINDREAILRIHGKNKSFAQDVDYRQIAVRTPGFSGADLANLMNEGAILAARENKTIIEQAHLYEAIEKVLLGPERRSRTLSEQEKKITAYHEAGHALVAASLKDADPVHKISIIARGAAGGYTLKLPTEDRYLKTRKQFLADLAMTLGGYSAEELIFKDITTGASNDLAVASEIARRMVTRYGMGKFGPITFGKTQELIFLGKEISTERNYSDSIASEIDAEVEHILSSAHRTAKEMLRKYKDALDALAQKLMEKETIEKNEFDALIKQFTIKPAVFSV